MWKVDFDSMIEDYEWSAFLQVFKQLKERIGDSIIDDISFDNLGGARAIFFRGEWLFIGINNNEDVYLSRTENLKDIKVGCIMFLKRDMEKYVTKIEEPYHDFKSKLNSELIALSISSLEGQREEKLAELRVINEKIESLQEEFKKWKNVIRFVELSSKYPLSFGVEPKNEKENKLLTSILEKLYKFTGWDESKDINYLANARSAFRDYEVFLAMSDLPLKDKYIDDVFGNLESTCKDAFNKIAAVMKTHQKLNEYFKQNFTMKPSDFKSEISKAKYDYKNKEN